MREIPSLPAKIEPQLRNLLSAVREAINQVIKGTKTNTDSINKLKQWVEPVFNPDYIATDDAASLLIDKFKGDSGDAVDFIFVRSATQPPTPEGSIVTPTGWFSLINDANASGVSLPLWSSVGRQTFGNTYIWEIPIRIEGGSVAELSIFVRSATAITDAPTGGTYAFSNPPVLVAPTSWFGTIPSGTDPVYTSRAVVSAAAGNINAVAITGWSVPVISHQNGENGITGLLTNEVHAIGTASDGTGGSFANAGGNFKVYFGLADVTSLSTFAVATATISGLTLTIDAATGLYSLAGTWAADNSSFTLTATFSGTTLTKIYTISKSKAGDSGLPGSAGVKGDTGASYYTWLKYADSPTTGISDSPTNKLYMGVAYNKVDPNESNVYADYSWSLIQGPGIQGIPGTNTYTWVKYATNATGTTGFSDSPTGCAYIGLSFNQTTATESVTATDYTWSLIQGVKGDLGPTIDITSNRDLTFDSTDNTLVTGQANIVLTAKTYSMTGTITYAWSGSYFDTNPTAVSSTTATTYTITPAVFSSTQTGATSTAGKITCSVTNNGTTYSDTVTILRNSRSTAEAGATVGGVIGTNIDPIATGHIVDNAVSIPMYSTGGAFSGGGINGWIALNTLWITLPQAADIIVIATANCVYTGNQHSWGIKLYVEGAYSDTIGGTYIAQSAIALSFGVRCTAGAKAIQIQWYGDNANVGIASSRLTIMAVFK
jgi:hypothetical protein